MTGPHISPTASPRLQRRRLGPPEDPDQAMAKAHSGPGWTAPWAERPHRELPGQCFSIRVAPEKPGVLAWKVTAQE